MLVGIKLLCGQVNLYSLGQFEFILFNLCPLNRSVLLFRPNVRVRTFISAFYEFNNGFKVKNIFIVLKTPLEISFKAIFPKKMGETVINSGS